MGLGSGGHSSLGAATGRPRAEMVQFLRNAYDLGVNLFDTAPAYGDGRSEELIGDLIRAVPRDRIVVSTKVALAAGGPGETVVPMRPEAVGPALDESLSRLGTDYLDIALASVADVPGHYQTVIDDLFPALQRAHDQGKVRFLGASEQTRSDGTHHWLQHLLGRDLVDVVMIGHNMVNQSAQRTVLPKTRADDIGVMNIFTVRNVFSNPSRLAEVIAELMHAGLVDGGQLRSQEPLGWLVADGVAESMIEAAYRYAAYTPGVTSVMCGSVDAAHLADNIRAVHRGPLPAPIAARLTELFGRVAVPIGN